MKSLLVITGGMGVGKTSVLAEASDLLALRRIPHAAIDVDALGLAYLPSAEATDAAMYNNLRLVCGSYAAHGVERFLLARAMENPAQLDICREIIAATDTAVCRLIASLETMQRRVLMREMGISQQEYVARVAKLNHLLDLAGLEDFTVWSENRSLTDVALEVLVKAGWMTT